MKKVFFLLFCTSILLCFTSNAFCDNDLFKISFSPISRYQIDNKQINEFKISITNKSTDILYNTTISLKNKLPINSPPTHYIGLMNPEETIAIEDFHKIGTVIGEDPPNLVWVIKFSDSNGHVYEESIYQ